MKFDFRKKGCFWIAPPIAQEVSFGNPGGIKKEFKILNSFLKPPGLPKLTSWAMGEAIQKHPFFRKSNFILDGGGNITSWGNKMRMLHMLLTAQPGKPSWDVWSFGGDTIVQTLFPEDRIEFSAAQCLQAHFVLPFCRDFEQHLVPQWGSEIST
jgi:hypothetical protein